MRRRNDFIERSISGVLLFFRETVLSEEFASRKGLLQSLGPRVKVVVLTGLIVCVMFFRDIRPVLAVYFACLCLAAASRIPLRFFLKRTLVFIPLFSLLIALPSIFSVFTPGQAVWHARVAGLQVAVTRQGLEGAALFVSRVLVSVSLAVLMVLTTRSSRLFAALRRLGVPAIFVMTMAMCYRYVFLFAAVVQNMFLAIKSRSGGEIHYRRGQKIVAWNIAVLWHKSTKVNRDVYNAMRSRGYH